MLWFNESYKPKEYIQQQEIHLSQDDPSLALSASAISFTVNSEGVVSPTEHRIDITNERGGVLQTCAVAAQDGSPLPPWLSVKTEGSGNAQTLVNTIDASAIPAESLSVSASVKVTAANAANSASYAVTVEVDGLLEGVDITAATAGGLAWFRYDGFTSIPPAMPAEPTATGYTSDFSKAMASAAANSYIHFEGYVEITRGAMYNFDLTYAQQARLAIAGRLVATTAGGNALSIIGLKSGWHTITLDFCGDVQTAAPQITVGMSGGAAAPLDAALRHVPFSWENTLELLEPIGGEHYDVRDTLAVTWKGDHIAYPALVVSLTLDDGESWHTISDGMSTPCADGILQWVIPQTILGRSVVSGSCRARIMDYTDGTIQNVSPQVFGIGANARVRGSVSALPKGLTYRIGPNGIVVRGLANGGSDRVVLTSVHGRILCPVRASREVYIPLENLGHGMYLITVTHNGSRCTIPIAHGR